MQMKKSLLLGLTILLTNISFGQIQIGGDEPVNTKAKKEKTAKLKGPVDTTKFKTEIFAGASVMHTFRNLSFNPNELFAKPYSDREQEFGLIKPSVHLGLRHKLNNFLMLEGVVSYYQNGERFEMVQTDTTHIYTTTYNHVGVGLKLYYYYTLNKVDFLVGVGLQPNFRMKYNRKDEYVDANDRSTSSEMKSKDRMSGIGVNVLANAGVQYNFHPRVGIYLMAEYRTDLGNMFQKYEPHVQKNYGIGGTLGISVKF